MKPDIARVAQLIAEVADAEILPRFRRLAAHEVQAKSGPDDLVTAADLAVERTLGPQLLAAVPGSVLVAEEGAETDPDSVLRLVEDRPVWLLDPVDGTHNFAHGVPGFAVMVAYVEAGHTRAAWIYDPLSRAAAIVEEGAGAFLDGVRLKSARPANPADCTGVAHLKFLRDEPLRARLLARRGRLGRLQSLGCAGLEYLGLSAGVRHFGLYTRLKPWDHAPGVLLLAEAGGHSAFLESQARYRPQDITFGALLSAPDREVWEQMRATLLG